ncbi:MAG: hypothetical protein KKG09_07445 [Verrucomicrobia bacterium]|nr:hypothetical protein [Verrucomicrobiota bacterium]MBU4290880.1 hypothetical protein [Verrucomicrobiota bacterium]MBU4429687.1 hypothetical protein [Verrucomicrobiota bacterium]MBU4497820.1 hypothetical protein [Verrucomicrobiota bacterium]MCG2680629.1 hypothetical protein [Kiritimatiellia bacterium]
MILRQKPYIGWVAAFLALVLNLPVTGAENQPQSSPHSLSIGGRYHTELSVFTDLPYGNGDLSYLLAYQYTQGFAIWQFACDLGPDVSGKKEVYSGTTTNMVGIDYIVTPQFNVIIKDRFFRGGGGIRTSYIRDADDEGKWLDPYWQLQFGLSFPLSNRISVDVSAYYVYERWDKLLDFKFGDLEYGALLNLAF